MVRADIGKVEDIERAVEETRAKLGLIDVVFANAGATTVAPLEAVTEAYVAENIAVKFTGTFFTIQKAAPLMAKGGSIIVTTSFLNTIGYPGLSILAATKAATRSLVRTLGAELAPRGIRVNAVSPGAIATPLYSKIGLPDAMLSDVASSITQKIGLKRFGEPVELAKSVLFLAGDDSVLHDRHGAGGRWRLDAVLIYCRARSFVLARRLDLIRRRRATFYSDGMRPNPASASRSFGTAKSMNRRTLIGMRFRER